MPNSESPSHVLIAAEYTNLRAEIIKLVELQHQILFASIVAVGAFLTVGLRGDSKPSVLLAYPLVSLFLASQWARDDFRIRQIAGFLHKLELRYSEFGWVGHLMQSNPKSFMHEGYVFSTAAMFLTAQLLTFFCAFTKENFVPLDYLLISLDIACMMTTVNLIRLAESDVKYDKAPIVDLPK